MVNRFNDPHIFEKSRWCPSRPALLAFFSDLKRPVPTTHRWHVFISHDLATIECLSCLLNAVLCTTKAVETQLVFSHCGMASNRWFYHCWMGLAVRLFGAHKWWSCEEMLLLLRAGQWPSGPVAQWPSGPVAQWPAMMATLWQRLWSLLWSMPGATMGHSCLTTLLDEFTWQGHARKAQRSV